jgi:hypothetical protein
VFALSPPYLLVAKTLCPSVLTRVAIGEACIYMEAFASEEKRFATILALALDLAPVTLIRTTLVEVVAYFGSTSWARCLMRRRQAFSPRLVR